MEKNQIEIGTYDAKNYRILKDSITVYSLSSKCHKYWEFLSFLNGKRIKFYKEERSKIGDYIIYRSIPILSWKTIR